MSNFCNILTIRIFWIVWFLVLTTICKVIARNETIQSLSASMETKIIHPLIYSKNQTQLNTLISKTKILDLENYSAEYANQVAHALQKAEKVTGNVTSTDEQYNLTRLELQVAMDLLIVDLQKATIPDLQDLVKAGKLTYKELTQMYLNRIELYDCNTIKLNSVRILNVQALSDAEKCDLAFKSDPNVATGMFGIPILVKDNINVTGMPTTAGSVALADNYAPYDAFLVTKLKASGAVILGKANLTEFANYIALNMSNGFSSLGRQVRNPYRPVRLLGDTISLDVSGSSAGSGSAASAALAAITVGTETSGSILSPSSANSITGIKPTVGLISRYGVIPIAASQDIAGPMGRNITDVAVLLNVLAGYDPNDNVTEGIGKAGVTGVDYTRSLKLGGLKGKRIGLVGIPPDDNVAFVPFQKALQVLKDAGVEIITKPDGTALTYNNPENPDVNPPVPRTIVFDYEFARDLPAYLATLDKNHPIKSLQNIVDFNNKYMASDSSAFPSGQAIMERCAKLDLETQKEQYLIDREKDILYSRENGIDYLLKEYNLDCLISTSRTGNTTVIGAKAGYPTVSIPLANRGGTTSPINLHFTGAAFSEANLIEFAFTVEQATHFRIPPGLADKSILETTLRTIQELPAEKRVSFQSAYDSALTIYHNNFATQMVIDKVNDELLDIVKSSSLK
jgi:amidase